MAVIIMAGHNFTESTWDENMVVCAASAKTNHDGLTIALIDMANRAEFGAEIAKIGKRFSTEPGYLNYIKGL